MTVDNVTDPPAEAGAPAEPQGAAPEAPPAEPQGAAPEAPPAGPWSNDLEQRFTDPDQRTAVDTFLRETVQPYVTQLEQRPDLPEGAQTLWEDVSGENPDQALRQLVYEVYGEQHVPYFDQAMQYASDQGTADPSQVQSGPEFDPQYDPYATEPESQQPQLPQEQQETLDWAQEQRDEQQYTEAMGLLQQQAPDIFPQDVESAKDLFAPFLNATEGDLAPALEQYTQHLNSLASMLGVSPEQAVEVAEQAAENATAAGAQPEPAAAPATLGPGGTAPNVPASPDYGSDIGAAVRDWVADERSRKAAPPTV